MRNEKIQIGRRGGLGIIHVSESDTYLATRLYIHFSASTSGTLRSEILLTAFFTIHCHHQIIGMDTTDGIAEKNKMRVNCMRIEIQPLAPL